jgi:hypothetical protein
MSAILVSTMLSLATFGAPPSADHAPAVAVPSTAPPNERLTKHEPTEVARRVFEGSPFWWKHRKAVEDPTRGLGFFDRIWQALVEVGRFFKSVLGRILKFLSWLMPRGTLEMGAPTGGTNWLLWGLGALALAVIAFIVYRSVRRRRLLSDVISTEPLSEPERLPDAMLLLTRAKAALAAGDTFEALRLGFHAVLASLEDRGIVRYDAARTNSEYLRDLRPQPVLAAGFRRVALPFDRAFYGKIRPERADVERTLEFCQSLLTAPAATT